MYSLARLCALRRLRRNAASGYAAWRHRASHPLKMSKLHIADFHRMASGKGCVQFCNRWYFIRRVDGLTEFAKTEIRKTNESVQNLRFDMDGRITNLQSLMHKNDQKFETEIRKTNESVQNLRFDMDEYQNLRDIFAVESFDNGLRFSGLSSDMRLVRKDLSSVMYMLLSVMNMLHSEFKAIKVSIVYNRGLHIVSLIFSASTTLISLYIAAGGRFSSASDPSVIASEDLKESRAELFACVQSLREDLQEWRGKLDTQVQTYRHELGELRNTLNTVVDQLRNEFQELRDSLQKQLGSTTNISNQISEQTKMAEVKAAGGDPVNNP